ncbi:MAG: hypothetical protein JXA25_13135 [Anaerolineales bacterium]|nr:hypothetical protein [Anaerolineales bacterium]
MPIEARWFGHEIIPDPDLAVLHLRVDSQLLDTFNMEYYEEWKGSQPMLLNISIGNEMDEMKDNTKVRTRC